MAEAPLPNTLLIEKEKNVQEAAQRQYLTHDSAYHSYPADTFDPSVFNFDNDFVYGLSFGTPSLPDSSDLSPNFTNRDHYAEPPLPNHATLSSGVVGAEIAVPSGTTVCGSPPTSINTSIYHK